MKNRLSFLLALLLLLSCSTEETAPDDQPLGVSARSFLTDDVYDSLVVEIVYVTGFEPSGSTLSAVKTFLGTYLHKPGGIQITTRAIPAPGMGTYSISEVNAVEDMHRSVFTSGKKLSTFIFIADDKSDSSTSEEYVLGKAYKNTSLVIFEKDIRTLGEKEGIASSQIQEITIKHEFGHLFGLVDNGTPAQSDHVYQDPNNPGEKGHCSVNGCLMARNLDYEKAGSLSLEELCHLDLVANGGK